jgi:hypothetical protein
MDLHIRVLATRAVRTQSEVGRVQDFPFPCVEAPATCPLVVEGSKYRDGAVAAIGSGGVARGRQFGRWKYGSAVRLPGIAGWSFAVAVLAARGMRE